MSPADLLSADRCRVTEMMVALPSEGPRRRCGACPGNRPGGPGVGCSRPRDPGEAGDWSHQRTNLQAKDQLFELGETLGSLMQTS